MDPVANMEAQRKLASNIILAWDENEPDYEVIARMGNELAELVEALDFWRQNGGFSPYPAAEIKNRDGGDLPTVAQFAEIRRRMGKRDPAPTIFIEPFDLPAGYVLVRWADGFQCGISRSGQVSS